jgi:hypothetical protein
MLINNIKVYQQSDTSPLVSKVEDNHNQTGVGGAVGAKVGDTNGEIPLPAHPPATGEARPSKGIWQKWAVGGVFTILAVGLSTM